MLDPKQIDDLTRRLSVGLPQGVKVLQEDISRGLRTSLQSSLARMDLVTREEFDVQAAVLARTRAKLEKLEKRLAEFEQQPSTNPAD